MGTLTTLSSITVTPTEDSNGAVYGEDVVGMLLCAQTKAQELQTMLTMIVTRLPNGDPNIATINSVISALS